MKVKDARDIAELAKISPTFYSFDEDRHEALCILAYGQQWKVFENEKGAHFEEHVFSSEDEACVYFLKRLLYLYAPR